MKARASFVGLCVFIKAFLGSSSHGQAVIGISPGSTSSGVFAPGGSNKPNQPAPLSSIKSAMAKQGPLFQWGVLALRPHFSYGVTYGNGILRVPGEPENTTVQTLSPGVLLELGSRATLDYTLTRNIYSSRLIFDTTDHNIQLQGSFVKRAWRFGASQSYGSNSPTLVETGGQTAEETYSTAANIAYEIGSRTLIETAVHRHFRSASPLFRTDAWTGSDWAQWSASTWLRYTISHQLNAGVGFQTGYDEIRDNPDMSYTKPQVRLSWMPTEKLSLSGQFGLERRKTRVTAAKIQKNTVYSASGQYQILQKTGLSLGANQNVSSSYFADQTTKSSGWNVGIDQRLFVRFFGSARYGRGRTTYLPTINRPFIERDDQFESFSISLSTKVLRRGMVSIFYSRSRNKSNNQNFGFITNQMGANFAYRF